MVSCPSCGLRLPDFARFCARCGRRLPPAARVAPVWVLVVFWAGTLMALGIAAVYATIVAVPDLASAAGNPADAREAAVVVVVIAGCLTITQLVASIGLSTGQPWARPVATVVCVAWCLTCVGLLVSLPVLNAMWRDRRRTEPSLGPPPP